SFEALTRAVGKEPDEIWTEEDRMDFSSAFYRFQKKFYEKGGKNLPVTSGDAFLFYLSLYSYEEIINIPEEQLRNDVDRIWNELPMLNRAPEEALVMEPEESSDTSLINMLKSLSGNILESKATKVAFLHDRPAEQSSWTYGHELGRAHLEEVFEGKIETKSYFLEGSGKDTAELLEQAVKDGNDIIFTANQKFLGASLKTALDYPAVRILNCSINRSYNAIGTYYGRMYEAKFLCGMVAGIMTPNDKVAYCADIPIYGAFANVNAFALGARMTNPRVKVYVHWLSDKTSDLEQMIKEHDIRLVSDTDMIRLSNEYRKYGLYLMKEDDNLQLTVPMWNWGKFYEKIVREIQAGNWNKSKALNYWWGISSDIVDLIISDNLPVNTRFLVETMRKQIFTEEFHPFQGEITLQDGTVIGEEESVLSPEQIITMDWFVENVVGKRPLFENLTEEAKTLLALQEEVTPVVGEIDT
ncbi:MAG: BMP family ABC transporter substrate-binding protein, partial [Lachnospiraceae bacterium]|nr:BMP family ABC transporter substrate-binding protein [Lachnospiraceae bacterium]